MHASLKYFKFYPKQWVSNVKNRLFFSWFWLAHRFRRRQRDALWIIFKRLFGIPERLIQFPNINCANCKPHQINQSHTPKRTNIVVCRLHIALYGTVIFLHVFIANAHGFPKAAVIGADNDGFAVVKEGVGEEAEHFVDLAEAVPGAVVAGVGI